MKVGKLVGLQRLPLRVGVIAGKCRDVLRPGVRRVMRHEGVEPLAGVEHHVDSSVDCHQQPEQESADGERDSQGLETTQLAVVANEVGFGHVWGSCWRWFYLSAPV